MAELLVGFAVTAQVIDEILFGFRDEVGIQALFVCFLQGCEHTPEKVFGEYIITAFRFPEGRRVCHSPWLQSATTIGKGIISAIAVPCKNRWSRKQKQQQ
jgi:hypothetical protein